MSKDGTSFTDRDVTLEVYERNADQSNQQGYVAYPNVNVIEEMTDMMSATRSYEANVTVSKASMSMQMKSMEILSK